MDVCTYQVQMNDNYYSLFAWQSSSDEGASPGEGQEGAGAVSTDAETQSGEGGG